MSNLVIPGYAGEDLTFRVSSVYGPKKRYIRDLTFLINRVDGEAVIDVSERYGDGRIGYGGGSYLFPLKFAEAFPEIQTGRELQLNLCSILAEHEYQEGVECSRFKIDKGSGAKYFNMAQALRDKAEMPRFNQALIKQFMIKGCKGKIYRAFEDAIKLAEQGKEYTEEQICNFYGAEEVRSLAGESFEELEELDKEEADKIYPKILRQVSILQTTLEIPAWERRLRHKVARGLKNFAGKLEKYN